MALAAALLGGFTMRALANTPGSYVALWAVFALAALTAVGVVAAERGGTSPDPAPDL